jgi:hypothetical protein
MSIAVDIASVVELAERQSQDSEITLYWARRSGRLWVKIADRHTGRTTRIDATAANALDVFHHPCFYERQAA